MAKTLKTDRTVEVQLVEILGDGRTLVKTTRCGAGLSLGRAFEEEAATADRWNERVQIRHGGKASRFEVRVVYAPAVPSWKSKDTPENRFMDEPARTAADLGSR